MAKHSCSEAKTNKKQRRKATKDRSRCHSHEAQAQNANPFETIWSRRKFDILGKKRKGEERRIGLARSRAVQKVTQQSRKFCQKLYLPLNPVDGSYRPKTSVRARFSGIITLASALVTVTETLRGFFEIYDELNSFPEIFSPIKTLELENFTAETHTRGTER
ncbi:hypothetical protein DITRI_Ditri12bG0012200 [Diplodiscus trichospermus]